MDNFPNEISRHIWSTRYRADRGGKAEQGIEDTWRRVAGALAAAEGERAGTWEARFLDILRDFHFLPGGRIQAGAGTARHVTLFNCFVMGEVEDTIPGIFSALQDSAVTMQAGGGIGLDFSTLRPRGVPARDTANIASGPVSFMGIWDAMCGAMLSMGARRGAMMATLRCDHPDIEEFVAAKHESGRLRYFNLSVQATDAFIAAARNDEEWPLVFPASAVGGDGPVVERVWSGSPDAVPCRVIRRVRARELWEKIQLSAYDYAEPGVLFIDRINRENNLYYCEHIGATNPCGEVPLPPHGACDLGSLNLTRFVAAPFTPSARIDHENLARTARVAVRLLDDAIDVSRFPLPAQAEQVHRSRRVGLGITGLADALVMLGLRYGSDESIRVAADTMRLITHAAYRASIEIAKEKASFPCFDRDKYLAGKFVRALPEDIRDGIAAHGIRNSHLTAIAPTGTISLLAGNVSSGLEPIFAVTSRRQVLDAAGVHREFVLNDRAIELWREATGAADGLPPAFVTMAELDVNAHLDMQAALQPYVDNAISKTVNVPADYPFEDFKRLYDAAYDRGLKGCTAFRPNPVTGSVLVAAGPDSAAPCCTIEREAD